MVLKQKIAVSLMESYRIDIIGGKLGNTNFCHVFKIARREEQHRKRGFYCKYLLIQWILELSATWCFAQYNSSFFIFSKFVKNEF